MAYKQVQTQIFPMKCQVVKWPIVQTHTSSMKCEMAYSKQVQRQTFLIKMDETLH